MTTSRLPNRLLSPLWRAQNYIELHAGMQDPALVARKARERKEAAAPVVVQEKTIRIGGGGGSDSTSGTGTYVLKTGDGMSGDLTIDTSTDAGGSPTLWLNADAAGWPGIDFEREGVDKWWIGVETPANVEYFGLYDTPAGVYSLISNPLSSGGALVINPSLQDRDTQIKGDIDPNALYVDASTDRVGIGTAAPTQKLHVNGGVQIASTNKVNFFNTGYWIRASSGLELNTADYLLVEVGGAERLRVADTLVTLQTGALINGDTTVQNGNLGVIKFGGTPELGVKSQIGAGYAPAFINIARWGLGGTATPNNEYVGALWWTGLSSTNAFAGFSKIECGIGVNTSTGAPSYLRLSSVLTNVEDAAIMLDSRAAVPYVGINENSRNVDTIIRGDIDTTLIFADASTDRVGLGTSSPLEKLDVRGNQALAGWIDFDEALGAKLYTWSNTYGLAIEPNEQRYFAATGARHSFRIGGYSGTDVLSISGTAIVLNNDSVVIDTIIRGDVDATLLYAKASNDRVGIGTATPSTKFEVIGQGRFTLNGGTALAVNAPTAGQTAELGFEDALTRKWVLMKTTANEFSIYDMVIGSTVLLTPGSTGITYLNYGAHGRDTIIRGDLDQNLVFVDASTDRVGIGMNNPQVKFDVTGTIRALNNGVGVRISSAAPTQQAELWFDEAAAAKWAIYKNVTNSLAIYNAVLARDDVLIDRIAGQVTITNLAGSGTRIVGATNVGLLTTAGISIDALQDVAITAPANGEVLTFNGSVWANNEPSQGIITLDDRTHVYAAKFGTAGAGNGQFNTPGQIVIDTGGNIYVADTANNRIQKFNSAGTWLANITGLTGVTGVAVDPSTGEVYAGFGTSINVYNNALVFQLTLPMAATVRHLFYGLNRIYATTTASSSQVRYQRRDGVNLYSGPYGWTGTAGSGNGQFTTPVGITYGNGYFYVADQGNDRVQLFTNSGVFVTKFGRTGSDPGEFQNPSAITVNKITGHVLVTDTLRDDVQEFTFEGGYVGQFAGPGSTDGKLQNAQGVAVTTDGASVWVSDATQARLQKFTESVTTESAISIAMNPEDFIVASDPTTVGQAYISLITPAKSLAALDDVVMLDEAPGDVIMFNGATWGNTPHPTAGMVLIKHLTFTNAGFVNFNDVFSSDFFNYMLVAYFDAAGASGAETYLRFRLGTTDDATAGDYVSQYSRVSTGGVFAGGGAASSVAIQLIPGFVGGTWQDVLVTTMIGKPNVATSQSTIRTQWQGICGGLDWYMGNCGGNRKLDKAHDGCTLLVSSGAMTGFATIYGMVMA
jgi:6-bladed beta-propeller/NHL repeat